MSIVDVEVYHTMSDIMILAIIGVVTVGRGLSSAACGSL
jgi:hypothetical protein